MSETPDERIARFTTIGELRQHLAKLAFRLTYKQGKRSFDLPPVYIVAEAEDEDLENWEPKIDVGFDSARVFYTEDYVDNTGELYYTATEVLHVGFSYYTDRQGSLEEDWRFDMALEEEEELLRKCLSILWEKFVLEDLADV